MAMLMSEFPTPVAQVYQDRASAGDYRVSSLASPSIQMPPREWLALFEHLKSWRARASHDAEINADACHKAVLYAWSAALRGEQLPTRIGLTNNGGVAFEWERGDALVHIEVLDARHAEYTEFRGTKLIEDAELVWDVREQSYVTLDS